MDFLSMCFRYTQIRLYSVLHGVHLVLGCTTRTFLQRLHNLSRPALVFCSALSASLPSGAAFCFGVHAEACDSECGCRPHSTFIIWFCRAFKDFSCFVGKVVPFVLIRRGLLFSAIVRRMSPADLGDPGETGRARLTWAAWIPWEIKILHQKWLWIGGMTIWMDGCIAGWIMRTHTSPRFILPLSALILLPTPTPHLHTFPSQTKIANWQPFPIIFCLCIHGRLLFCCCFAVVLLLLLFCCSSFDDEDDDDGNSGDDDMFFQPRTH